MARQRAQEAAARLSAAIFGGTPQTPGDAGSAPPLAAATAAPGSTLAADVVEGERVAAPGGAPQEQGAIVPDSTAGTVHKLQEKKDEGRAHTRYCGSCFSFAAEHVVFLDARALGGTFGFCAPPCVVTEFWPALLG